MTSDQSPGGGAPIDTWTVAVDADISGLENGLKLATGSGKQFSAALQRHPRLFGPLYIHMVR
ncbi:MAG: hypothetical protein K2Y05_04060, partial [Hyphomicrobiaceae bacterium]|nr:hypothetical protein [Hyphomicrobiaceae bacterium]